MAAPHKRHYADNACILCYSLGMYKMFAYRIFPTKKQEGVSLSLYQQQATFPILKSERPRLTTVHSQVLQNVAVRLDLAMKAFFRRVKAGETAGYPRFKGHDRYDSITYPQSGFKIDEQGKLYASGIGHIKIVLHRPIRGKIKTLTIRRSSTGKW